MRRGPEAFLHGTRGARVNVLPADASCWLAQHTNLREVVSRAEGEVASALVAVLLTAQEVARRGSAVGTKPAPTSEPAAPSTQRTVSTAAVAGRLNFTTRAITRAIEDKRLAAIKSDTGTWRITTDEADRFVAETKGRAA